MNPDNSILFNNTPIRQLSICTSSTGEVRHVSNNEKGRPMRIYREFEGGYLRTQAADALLAAKKAGHIGKKELRLFFAELEREESGKRVGVDFLLNGERPKRRMTKGEQEQAREQLYSALEEEKSETPLTTKIPRKFARAAAKGAIDVSQMIAALFYFRWRKPQRRRRKLIWNGERYASFTFEQARSVTGLARSTLCKAFQWLRRLKVIAVSWRPMEQIKRFGMLFVDGEKLNLYCKKHERSRGSNPWTRLQKTRTQSAENANANRSTLPNNSFSDCGTGKETLGEILARMRARSAYTG